MLNHILSRSLTDVLSRVATIFLYPLARIMGGGGGGGSWLVALLLISINASEAQITVTPSSIAENAGTVKVSINNTGASQVTVVWRVDDGTAKSPADYEPIDIGAGNLAVLNPGESDSFDVKIIDDTMIETDESFIVNVNGTNHRITIKDNDTPMINVSPNSIAENVGTVTVKISNAGANQITVVWSVKDGTATNPADYEPIDIGAGNLAVLKPGESDSFDVKIVKDTVRESNEYFVVNVNGAEHRITIDEQHQATHCELLSTVSLSANAAQYDEGTQFTLHVDVRGGRITKGCQGIDAALFWTLESDSGSGISSFPNDVSDSSGMSSGTLTFAAGSATSSTATSAHVRRSLTPKFDS